MALPLREVFNEVMGVSAMLNVRKKGEKDLKMRISNWFARDQDQCYQTQRYRSLMIDVMQDDGSGEWESAIRLSFAMKT